MAAITIKFKDDRGPAIWTDAHRPGGSWENTVSYEGAMVVVTDIWGKRTAFPAADVLEVVETPRNRGW